MFVSSQKFKLKLIFVLAFLFLFQDKQQVVYIYNVYLFRIW